jgi:hypothetical protein
MPQAVGERSAARRADAKSGQIIRVLSFDLRPGERYQATSGSGELASISARASTRGQPSRTRQRKVRPVP